ncbi:MAG: type VI secretion system contractile sheath large subunit [Pirellulaceae bacterium]
MTSRSPETRSTILEQTLESAPGSSQAEQQFVSPLDQILAVTQPHGAPAAAQLDEFLAAPGPGQALRLWFGRALPATKDELARRLNRDVAACDALINAQLNAILHHPQFQKLEASWRGLMYLAERAEAEGDVGIKIKVLSVSWRELERDFERASEFDQSQLFRKIYDQEFGTPGGEPFGALLGDYEIRPRPIDGYAHDDIGMLRYISQVAAAAFCPFLTGVHPAFFGIDSFETLEQRLDHAKTFEQLDYLKWRAFRDTEDARFVGLVLPHVLMRLPYQDDGTRLDGFRFHEEVSGPDRSRYLWGNAAYAFGAVLIRAYAQAGWLADIRGVQRDVDGGGLVTALPVHSFGTNRRGVAIKSSTDVIITDRLEKELADLGFIGLCDCPDTDYSAFFSNQSTQKPKRYDRPAATTNARISSMLQYMLCVSRFAHYIKVLGREKIGSFTTPDAFEQFLQEWVVRYVTTDVEAPAETKARFPLREAKVQVFEQPGKPGAYQCVMHLAPHYELDEMIAAVRIATELAPARVS